MEKIRKNEEIFMNYERKIQEKREKLKSEGKFKFYFVQVNYNNYIKYLLILQICS